MESSNNHANSSESKTPSSSTKVSFFLPDDNEKYSLISNFSLTGSLTPSSLGNMSRHSSSSVKSDSLKNRDGTPQKVNNEDLLLIPPSQTIGQSLTALASTTAIQLEHVWDEVGYNSEERASQLTDLLSEFGRLCEEKVAYERGVAETFRRAISEAKDEYRLSSLALRLDIDQSLVKGDPASRDCISLQDELAALEANLEDIRTEAQCAKEDLSHSRDTLLALHNALGTDLEEEWKDIESDLTKGRRQKFRERTKEMEEMVETRTMAIVQLLKDCYDLIKIMKIDPSLDPLDKKILGSLSKENEGRVTIKSRTESDGCTGIGSKALEKLTIRVSELNGEKKRRKEKLAHMGADIGALWEKLQVSMEEQKKFAESIDGLGSDTMEKGEKELERLHELKTTMMGKLIKEAREKIKVLWDKVSISVEQRSSFKGMSISDESDFTDDILIDHEEYITLLEKRLQQIRPICLLIEKRENILHERMEYEQFQKDPERLQQRGSALTKQLMKEEKMCRRIKKDLPKYTDHLDKKLREWEVSNKEPFLYTGQVYLDKMSHQEEEWQQYKDNQIQMKLKKKQNEKVKNARSYQPPLVKKKGGSLPTIGQRSRSTIRSGCKVPTPLSDATNQGKTANTNRVNQALPNKLPGSKDVRARSASATRFRPKTRP